MTRSEEDSLVDGPLISDDALHAAIRTEFHTVPTGCYAVLLSLLHVWTEIRTHSEVKISLLHFYKIVLHKCQIVAVNITKKQRFGSQSTS